MKELRNFSTCKRWRLPPALKSIFELL